MTLKKTAFVFCVLCLVLCSCGIGNVPLEYTFDNKSTFTIQITLSEPYKTDKDDEVNKKSPFSVFSSDVEKVYVKNNGVVDFKWTTSYIRDNPKLYCITKG